VTVHSCATHFRRYDAVVKVVHIESGRHLYGGARQVGYLIDGLRGRGVDNVLVCAPGQALAKAHVAAEVVELPMGGDLDVRMAARLSRLFARIEPDLIHVHSRRGADLFGGWASRFGRWPAVLTRRVERSEPAAWVRFKCRPYANVVAVSSAVAAELRNRIGVDGARISRIPSAVDTELFKPDRRARARIVAELGLPDDACIVAMAAQMIPRKGHRRLLAALPQVLAQQPMVRVVLFGRGPLEPALREAAANLGDCVVFAGFRDDFASWLPGVDIVAHPAEREGLGVALLEAMSCGVPVVATAVGGIVDAIDDDREGLLVPPGDTAALAAALMRLSGDDVVRRRLGAAGRARVEREFSIALMAGRYLDLYRTIHAGRARTL
jgi:glycosyltransferase involved in cell wall biosynthesis